MLRNLIFSEGEYYHIYNRGVEKKIIFPQKSDYCRFIALLYILNTSSRVNFRESLNALGPSSGNKGLFSIERDDVLVDIGAYCLMPNHFHLLIKEKIENGTSFFMKKLLTGYSMYFNKKYNRKGPLFESRFMAQHADSDEYLKYLYSYIHLNPIKLTQPDWKESGIKDIRKAQKYLDSYKYSSYIDYTNFDRREKKVINPEVFPEYFLNSKDFKNEIIEWLSFLNPSLLS